MWAERFCTHWRIEAQSREKIDDISRYRYATLWPNGNNKRFFAASIELIVDAMSIVNGFSIISDSSNWRFIQRISGSKMWRRFCLVW